MRCYAGGCRSRQGRWRAFHSSPTRDRVVKYSEITRLRDIFGHQRLREKKYTAGKIDTRWAAPIEADFTEWRRANANQLPVPKEDVEEILKERSK